jgi:membrane protein
VLLMWVYYTAQIFLLGAEFTWVYAHRHGSRATPRLRQARAAEPLTQPLAGGMKLVGVVAAIGFLIGMITRR